MRPGCPVVQPSIAELWTYEQKTAELEASGAKQPERCLQQAQDGKSQRRETRQGGATLFQCSVGEDSQREGESRVQGRRIAQIAVVPERQEDYRRAPQGAQQQSLPAGGADDSIEHEEEQRQRNEVQSRTGIEHGAEIAPKAGSRKDVARSIELSGFAGPG